MKLSILDYDMLSNDDKQRFLEDVLMIWHSLMYDTKGNNIPNDNNEWFIVSTPPIHNPSKGEKLYLAITEIDNEELVVGYLYIEPKINPIHKLYPDEKGVEILYISQDFYEEQENAIYANQMGISKEFHSMGIASKLLNFIIEKYRNKNILLAVFAKNIKAINCYKKNGFEIIAKERSESTLGGKHEFLYMIFKQKYMRRVNND